MPEEPPNPTLWDHWRPPAGPDENSQAAAKAYAALGGDVRRRVACFIARNGPVAEWQVAQELGLPRPTSTPRIYELHRADIIIRDSKKGVTPSGRACWRYVVTPFWASYLESIEG